MGMIPFGSTNMPIGLPTDLIDRLGLNKRNTTYKRSPDTDKTGGFSISKFSETISSMGVSRPHLFFVEITSPRTGNTNRMVSLLCESASLPGFNIMSSAQSFKGYQYEVPYGIAYPDVSMNFLVDSNLLVKEFFDNWLMYIFDDNYNIKYDDSFRVDVIITQIDAETNTVYRVKLCDAFPKAVGDIHLSHSSNELSRIGVNFTYKRWEKLTGSQSMVRGIRDKIQSKGLDGLLSGIGSYFGNWDVTGAVNNAKSVVNNLENTTEGLLNIFK